MKQLKDQAHFCLVCPFSCEQLALELRSTNLDHACAGERPLIASLMLLEGQLYEHPQLEAPLILIPLVAFTILVLVLFWLFVFTFSFDLLGASFRLWFGCPHLACLWKLLRVAALIPQLQPLSKHAQILRAQDVSTPFCSVVSWAHASLLDPFRQLKIIQALPRHIHH